MDSLKEKRVLITGGSSGLGRALALEAVHRGARVAIVARRAEPLAQVRELAPNEIFAIQADVASKHDVTRISAEAIAALGGVDILIQNASTLGPTPLRPLMDTECEELSEVLETNLIGPFRLTKALLPGMLLRESGTVVTISSDAAQTAYPTWGAYSASKAALDQLARVWNEETHARGVRFLAVDPGEMDTPMHAAAIPAADTAALKTPESVARTLWDLLESRERLQGPARVTL